MANTIVRYGVFAWRSDGRYLTADPYADTTYDKDKIAQREADKLNELYPVGTNENPRGFVVRVAQTWDLGMPK